MKPISEHIVDSAWQEMAGLEIDEIRAMVDKMSEEQPYVLVYLMAAGEEGFSDEEREILLYIGMVVWRIMLQGDTPLPQVDEQMLDTAEAANFEMLEALGAVDAGFLVACTPESPRAIPAPEVAAAADALGIVAEAVPNVADAVERALALAGADDFVLVTGSLYVVGPARALLRTEVDA